MSHPEKIGKVFNYIDTETQNSLAFDERWRVNNENAWNYFKDFTGNSERRIIKLFEDLRK